MSNQINLKNITKKYYNNKNIKVLDDLNFSFQLGKTYSLVGPSGSGKSTLLNILSLIDKPTSGNLDIFNHQINFKKKTINDKIRSQKIGIIYQEKNLLNDFTALENVYLPNLLLTNDKNASLIQAKRIIKKIGLSTRLNHYPAELSGGESQRIAISRALINEPQIILADEPTGSLDRKTANEIFSLFLKLKSRNRAILYATHNRELSKRADYKLNILDGNITKKND